LCLDVPVKATRVWPVSCAAIWADDGGLLIKETPRP
jgi:hypothetical protein